MFSNPVHKNVFPAWTGPFRPAKERLDSIWQWLGVDAGQGAA